MRHSSLVISLLCAFVLATGPAIATPSTIEQAPCTEVAAWVAQNPEALPTDLAGFLQVPEGYETGVFKALPEDLRNQLWHDFLNSFAASKADLDSNEASDIMTFRDAFQRPEDFAELDQASSGLFENLLNSFTLHLIDPVADLVVEAEALNQIALFCNCQAIVDPGCRFAFCTPTQGGCGASGTDPCDGRY